MKGQAPPRGLVVGVLVGTPGSKMRTFAESADNSTSNAHDWLFLLLLNGTVLLHTNILATKVCNSLVSTSRKAERLDVSSFQDTLQHRRLHLFHLHLPGNLHELLIGAPLVACDCLNTVLIDRTLHGRR
mgnify:CR=1 FL=1